MICFSAMSLWAYEPSFVMFCAFLVIARFCAHSCCCRWTCRRERGGWRLLSSGIFGLRRYHPIVWFIRMCIYLCSILFANGRLHATIHSHPDWPKRFYSLPHASCCGKSASMRTWRACNNSNPPHHHHHQDYYHNIITIIIAICIRIIYVSIQIALSVNEFNTWIPCCSYQPRTYDCSDLIETTRPVYQHAVLAFKASYFNLSQSFILRKCLAELLSKEILWQWLLSPMCVCMTQVCLGLCHWLGCYMVNLDTSRGLPPSILDISR